MAPGVVFLFSVLALCTIACSEDGGTPTSPTPSSSTQRIPPAPPKSDVSGTVVEIGGGPLAAAKVSGRSCDRRFLVTNETLTDAHGAFRLNLESSPGGCLNFAVEKSGYEFAGPWSTETMTEVTLKMQRLRRVTGQVFEVDGSPLAGVIAKIRGKSPASTLTDASGFFVLSGVGGFFFLEMTNFAPKTVLVPEGQDLDLGRINLQRKIGIAPGSRLTIRLSPSDASEDWGEDVLCSPCKVIDLLEPRQQELSAEIHWAGSIPLTVWAASNYWDPFGVPSVRPDECTVLGRVQPGAHHLWVGVRTDVHAPQSIAEPITFELFLKEP